MTDQNNLARGYSSDVSDEDPLAELARIVSGQEPVVRKSAASPFQQPAPRPTEPGAAVAASAAPAHVNAPAFDLEDALMAELGFGDEAVAHEPELATPEAEPVVAQAVPEPVAAASSPAIAQVLSLEDQLLAELSFEDELAGPVDDDTVVEAVEALPVEEPALDDANELPAEAGNFEYMAEAAEIAEPEYMEEAIEAAEPELLAQPVEAEPEYSMEEPEPAAEAEYIAEPAVEPSQDEGNEYDELAAILKDLSEPQQGREVDAREEFYEDHDGQGGYFDEPEQQAAADPLEDLDFGSAFEAELRQMEVAAPVAAAASSFAVRKPHVSLATPVAPRREVANERELEDHFANAFAEELDLGVSRAMEQNPAAGKPATARQETSVSHNRIASAQPANATQGDFARRDAAAKDDPAAHWPQEDWAQEDWPQEGPDDQYARDPGHDGDDMDLGIAAMVPPAGGRSRGFKLAVGALGVAGLVCAAAIAVAFTGGGAKVASSDPVIVKADTSPVKVKPENPGGLEIANQDQVVYDKVAGGASGAGSQEKLVSAAEEPISIANVTEEASGEGQLPGEAATPSEVMPSDVMPSDVMPSDVMPVDAKADARLAPVADDAPNTVPALAPRRVKTMLIKPDGTVVPAEEAAAAEPAPATAALAAETQPGAALAPIEAAASAAPAEAAAPVEAAAAAAPDTTQVASTAPAEANAITGEWAVQLASQRSAEDAQATFQNLKTKFPDVLGGKALAVQRAEVEGKGVFYRVRVPAQTKEEAVALCEQLKAAGGSCFIAR